MNYFGSLLLGLSLTLPAFALTPTTLPTATPAQSSDDSADPLLGKTFRSRLDGIQFNPPAGGTMMRELNSGEVVRFMYPDNSWDIRIKPIVLATPLALTSGIGDGGVLEMTVAQLRANNQAQILRQEVQPIAAGGAKVALIEARYNAGINAIFAQEAIIEDTNQHYFELQMSAPGKPANAAANAVDANENEARKMFAHMVATLKVLDRQGLRDEQIHRVFQTNMLWVQLDRKKLVATVVPQHFMRVIQNGKDIGFIQVDERLVSHSGHEGIEYIVHSRVKNGVDQKLDAARLAPAGAAANAGAGGSTVDGNVVVPRGVVPGGAGAAAVAAAPTGPANLYTNSTYFVTFDRAHEDWNTTTQVDQQVGSQLTEMANSDLLEKRALNGAAAAQQLKNGVPGARRGQPPVVNVADYTLHVEQYAHGGRVGKAVDVDLPPFYLPQAMGQMLARLLPNDKEQYLFASYISNEKNVMARYVDVGEMTDVTLDGQQFHAIPISDRIGVDGIPTIHYVTRQGEWLGSVNENSKLQVLPTDARTLEEIWKSDPHGFAVCPLPPVQEDAPIVKKPATRPVADR